MTYKSQPAYDSATSSIKVKNIDSSDAFIYAGQSGTGHTEDYYFTCQNFDQFSMEYIHTVTSNSASKITFQLYATWQRNQPDETLCDYTDMTQSLWNIPDGYTPERDEKIEHNNQKNGAGTFKGILTDIDNVLSGATFLKISRLADESGAHDYHVVGKAL